MYIAIYQWAQSVYLQINFATLIVTICLSIGACVVQRKRYKVILVVCLVLYMGFLIFLTLGSRISYSNPILVSKIKWTMLTDWEDLSNVAMFLPCGILLQKLFGKQVHWYGVLLIGALTSAFLEWMQLILRCGYCDINDFINNVTGTIVGYLIGVVIVRCMDFLRKTRKKVILKN